MEMLDVYDLKIVVMIGLLLMAVIACVMPWMVSKYVKNTVVTFSVMNCLSGGVVLGAALSHMMPSAAANFVSYFADSDSFLKDYPLTPAIAAFGLILLLTIDRTLLSGEHSHSEVRDHGSHKAKKKKHSQKYNKHHHQQQSQQQPHYQQQAYYHGSQGYLSPDTPSVTHHHGSQNYSTFSNSGYPPSLPPSPSPAMIVTPQGHGSQKYQLYGDPAAPLYSPSPAEHLLITDESPRIDVGFNTDMLNKSISDYNAEHKSAVAKTWVFLLALSVHSVLEGLGMGAEDNEDSFFSVLFAVLAHKCLEAFALGLSIFYAKFSRTVTFFMIFGYSIATPLGVLIGMITSSLSSNQNLMAGILVSLASGSFMYISLIEILPTELHKPQAMGLKLSAMIFGWVAMVILAYFV